MAIARITKRTVDATEASTTDVFLWDSELRGFGLKVTPRGLKKYVIQYRLPGLGRRGTPKRVVLGTHGTLTPEEARQLAKRSLSAVAQGSDPAGERAARRGTKTVQELWTDYLDFSRPRLKPRTMKEYQRLFARHVAPALGSKLTPEIQPLDLRRLHRAMHKTPIAANRVVAMLGAFFTFAWKEGVLPPKENPAHTVEFYPESHRERFLSRDEFTRLGKALTQAETVGLPPAPQLRRKSENDKHRPKSANTPIPANPFAVAAIRLLALTGCRENEILSLRWDAVDFDRGYLRLADSKTGRSVRPLGRSAVSLLERLPRISGNPYVLPGQQRNKHLKEIKRLWYAVLHASKLPGLRLHDLRHSFASVPATSGESLLVVRSLLGHKNVATTERYAHLADDPVKRAADRASSDIAGWLSQAPTTDS
ncbi:MAG: tyrosine-type recombinase/integrase [Gemmatimonadaceae bacterium]